MDIKRIACFSALSLFATCSQAAVITYTNSYDLFTNPGLKTTYDFETLSGFPASSGTFTHIGMFNGINFDASVYTYGGTTTSGTRTMVGSSSTFDTANVDFSGLSNNVVGVGFWGLDLVSGANEKIVLNVNYSDSSSQSYDIALNGDASFTPEYFGLYSNTTSQSITSISLYSIYDNPLGASAAPLVIDDLTVITAGPVSCVPIPAGAWLFGSGLIGLVGVARRKRSA